MTCRDMVEFLMGYLENDIPEAQRVEFESHIQLCPPCLDYLETYKETIRLGKAVCQAEDEAVSGDVPEELVQAILAARKH